MKILAVSDQECKSLWDFYTPGKLKEYDIILSCGDLDPHYLSFLVTMGRAPVFYVHGNHDGNYAQNPPEGCDCVEDKIVVYKGLRILGLGGCRRYHPGPHQYSDRQMRARIRRLRWQLWRHKGVDIVLSHSAPLGYGDAKDNAHIGFEAFLELIDKYHPKFWIHGHVHATYGQMERRCEYGGTKIINAYERYVLELDAEGSEVCV